MFCLRVVRQVSLVNPTRKLAQARDLEAYIQVCIVVLLRQEREKEEEGAGEAAGGGRGGGRGAGSKTRAEWYYALFFKHDLNN